MKKVLLVLSIALLILALTGCPGWFIKPEAPEITEMSIPEMIEWIVENNATTAGDVLAVTEGIVTFTYTYYAYIVDENNNGIKVISDSDVIDFTTFNPGDRIKVVGSPYRKDYDDASEYRLDTETEGGEATLIESNVELPDPYVLPEGGELTLDLFGKLVQFTARYDGTDTYDNYLFDNGGVTVTVVKFSYMPADLTEGATYTIMGVVGQSYGYKLFVWDESYVQPVE